MAAARLDLASVFLYAGSILPGRREAIRRHGARRHDHRRLRGGGRVRARIDVAAKDVDIDRAGHLPRRGRVWRHVHCQHHGQCGRGNGHVAARQRGAAGHRSSSRRVRTAQRRGRRRPVLRRGITARDILTKEAFENAIAVVMAFGGSTNAVLHLLAIAHEADVKLSLEDFRRDRGEGATSGRRQAVRSSHVMFDVDRIGGVPVIMKALLDAGLTARRLSDGDRQDDGREPRAHRAARPGRQGAASALDNPIHPTGGITHPAADRWHPTARW